MIARVPCQKNGAKTIAFVVDESTANVVIIDNYVWAVACKEIPKKEFAKEWKKLQLPEDKVERMLAGLMNYAIYAGMTPQAAEYLPELYPMSKAAITVATFKGKEVLERFSSQAALEEFAEKQGKPLTGAALMAKAQKMIREHSQITEADADKLEQKVEELRAEPEKPKGRAKRGDVSNAERRRSAPKAKEARKLAAEVTKDLEAIEKQGGNPAKVLKQARGSSFDPAKLKGPDGEYKSASSMFKGLLLENVGAAKLKTDEQIFKAVQKKFGLSDDKISYVNWNRNWLKKEGAL